jgi:hypothetical protein
MLLNLFLFAPDLFLEKRMENDCGSAAIFHALDIVQVI